MTELPLYSGFRSNSRNNQDVAINKMAEGGGVPQLGGYHYEFVDEVPDKLKCPVCLLTLKDPMQIAKCGHRFCQLCIDRILR